MYMTRRQKEILNFLNRYIERKGYAPTIEETADHFGLSSLATVHKHLSNLQQKGLIRRESNRSRALELVATEVPCTRWSSPPRAGGRGLPHRGHPASETIWPRGHDRPRRDLRAPGEGPLDDRGADPRRRLRDRRGSAGRGGRGDGDRAAGRRRASLKKIYREGGGSPPPARERRLDPLYVARTGCACKAWSSGCSAILRHAPLETRGAEGRSRPTRGTLAGGGWKKPEDKATQLHDRPRRGLDGARADSNFRDPDSPFDFTLSFCEMLPIGPRVREARPPTWSKPPLRRGSWCPSR